jgi:hypothetical protein
MTYPGSAHIGKLPPLPLKVGDTWAKRVATVIGSSVGSWRSRRNPPPARIDAYHKAVARELGEIDTSTGVA